MSEKDVKKVAIDSLNVIRIYCKTANVHAYDDKTLDILRSEFDPIVRQCERVIRELESV